MDLTKYKECKAHKHWLFISNEIAPYKPCCWFRTDIEANTHLEYSSKLSECDVAKNCSYCIDMESAGGQWSPRTLFEKDSYPDQFVITASFDNFCNLKCVTCTPSNSTQVAAELPNDYVDFDGRTKRDFNRISQQAPDKIKFIKDTLHTVMGTKFTTLRFEILGGEPLLNPAIFEFLDWLAEQPYANKTLLCITTNTTVYTEKIKKYSEKFCHIGLQFSVDGIEDTFEYLRYNSDFTKSKENIDAYYNLIGKLPTNYVLSFNYTLSWMNSLHFVDFINWVQANYPLVSGILITKLESPYGYSVDRMSTDMRSNIIQTIEQNFTPINDTFDNAMMLFKQHLQQSDNTSMDVNGYSEGLSLLNFNDIKRKENHKIVLKPILELINSHITDDEKKIIKNKTKVYL